MAEIHPRIVGSEMEWGIMGRLEGTDRFSEIPDLHSVASNYHHPQIDYLSTFLSNGGRFYQDSGNHLEYATPEDISLEQFVTNEFSGEQIVIDALHRFIKGEEKYDAVKVRKRVIDDKNNTWGYHINLLADRATTQDSTKDLHLMGLHFATSLPLLGGGAIVANQQSDQLHYTFGQKINDLHYDYIHGTTQTQKAVINLRDEPLSDGIRFRRVHITSTDPHILPWATWMTMGSYSLILRAIEQRRPHQLQLPTGGNARNPLLEMAMQNNHDLTMRKTLHELGNRTLKQFDVQHELLQIVEQTDHTDEEAAVLREWKTAIDDLETNPKLLNYRSDAITRLTLIRHALNAKNEDPSNMESTVARERDELYDTVAKIQRHDATPTESYSQSIPAKLRKARLSSKNPSDEAIAARMFEPPQTTRAKIRGAAIARGAMDVNWHRYKFATRAEHRLDDPYMTEE